MKRISGFTLIEMAMVLFIIGLLISSLLIPTSEQMNQHKIKVTQQRLEKIKEALIGFAIHNGYLPCPNALPFEDGKGQPPPCSKKKKEGQIPWAVLGVNEIKIDGWSRPFRYRLDDAYRHSVEPIPVSTNLLEVKNIQGKKLVSDNVDYNVVAVIFSCGKNGIPDEENYDTNVTVNTPTCTNSDNPNNSIYTQDVRMENQFDDILIWLPRTILVNRLIAAGKWLSL